MDIRTQAQRERIARMVLIGMTANEIARKLHVTPKTVRYNVSTDSFKEVYDRVEREYFQAVDRELKHLFGAAVKTPTRMLRNKDWRARDSAIEKVLRLHGKLIDRLDLSGTLAHIGHVNHAHQHQLGINGAILEGDMTDEQRDLARKLLMTVRANQPRA